MNVIFVGLLHPKYLLDEICKLGSYVDYASYTFQSAIVSGLEYWYPDLKNVSYMRVDAYPKVKRVVFPPEQYSKNADDNKDSYFIGVINFPIIKRISEFFKYRRCIKKFLEKQQDNYVIIYSIGSPSLLAVASLKKYIKKSCLIVPDLPEFMSDRKGRVYLLLKKIDRVLINYAIKRIDTFALLSSHMKERLPIEEKQWKQMEGVYQENSYDIATEKKKEKIILYTGVLSERYGIKDLLDAFSMIEDPNYRLWLRGGGSLKELVIKYSQNDSRIKYIDPVPKEELIKMQREASVLVNPVRKSKLFTKYFFPSKTMEYLASGTPVVMYHLECMPSEYDEYINYIPEETIYSLKDILCKTVEDIDGVAQMRADKASIFIREKKNPVVQAKVIVDLLAV